MNALTPLAALLSAPNATINITVNGDVFLPEAPAAQPEFQVDAIFVSPEGVAQCGLSAEAQSAPIKQRPTVGRIVHYHPRYSERLHHGSKGSAPWAALITGVYEAGEGETSVDLVAVMAFPPGQKPYVPFASLRELPDDVKFDPTGHESFWSLPARA